ncbi:MAG: hypothetical protein ABL921_11340 [Pirellula sp.]
MSKYITCEADLNIPGPNVLIVAERIGKLYDGKKPVALDIIAKSFGTNETAIKGILRRAENARLIKQAGGQGWVPLNT